MVWNGGREREDKLREKKVAQRVSWGESCEGLGIGKIVEKSQDRRKDAGANDQGERKKGGVSGHVQFGYEVAMSEKIRDRGRSCQAIRKGGRKSRAGLPREIRGKDQKLELRLHCRGGNKTPSQSDGGAGAKMGQKPRETMIGGEDVSGEGLLDEVGRERV